MTQHVTRSDIPRLAQLLVEAGTRLGQHTHRAGHPMPVGEAAWFAALEFEQGPKAARVDAGTAGSVSLVDADPDDERPGYSDPTGEAAAGLDVTSLTLARYRGLLDWLDDNAADLVTLLSQLVPNQPNTKVTPCASCGAPRPAAAKRRPDMDAAALVEAGWCKSCYRDDQFLRLIDTRRATGQRYYRDFCRFCGGFKADHGIEPPLAVLRARHRDGQASLTLVQQECSHCKAKTNGGRPKARRSGWRRTPVS